MSRPTSRPLVTLTLLSTIACKTVAPAAKGGEVPTPVAPAPVAPVARYADLALGMEVVEGTLNLPARLARPGLRPAPGEAGIAQVFLLRPEALTEDPAARKRVAAERRRAVGSVGPDVVGEGAVRAAFRCYGLRHDGLGPASLDEPDWLRCVALGRDAEDAAPLPPPPPYARESPEGRAVARMDALLSRFALLARVPLRREVLGDGAVAPSPARKARGARKGSAAKAAAKAEAPVQPLLVEVAPAADDGRHWVLDNALSWPEERVPVDAALLALHGLALRKDRLVTGPAPRPGADDLVAWRVLALRRGGAAEVALELEPEPGARPERVAWAVAGGEAGTRALLQDWAAARLEAQDAFGAGDGPLNGPVLAAAVRAYALDEDRLERWERARRPERTDGGPSLLALLGGRAAVDETLQLDRELAAGAEPADAATIPVGEVQGISVEAHPWRDLLAGRRTPRLPLADCVPPDRAMLYLPQPQEALDGFENGAARFLQRVTSFAREGRLDYAVVERYLQDLGLGDGLGRRLLKLGAIRQAVIFVPDLSLLAGTDVTVVAEVSPLFLPLLPISEGEVREKETPGGKAWKARRGSRVFLSTSRAELDRALALDAAGGEGSLGRSEELGFLLLQLQPTERTQAFAYLSDPFIRRLVGPAQRIAKARLDRARSELELLAGAALLRRLDVPGEPPTVERLKQLGYLPPEFPADACRLLPDGRVASAAFGPLDRLRPVSSVAIDAVTPREAERYARFREDYTRYWRRFFDPIAVRLDAKADGSRELETFILPLLDSSIYRELGRELTTSARPAMTVPRWTFPPAIEASVQLPEKAFEAAGGELRVPDDIAGAAGVAPDELIASAAPTFHVAFPHAAPILQVGGGSAFGAFSAATGRGGEAAGSVVLAALTRPMVLAVELKDPERVRRALDRLDSPDAAPAGRGVRDWIRVRAARDDADRLIVTADFFGMVTLRHAVKVEGRWLVVTNDTTLPARLVDGERSLRGAAASVALTPGALRLGLPAAWQAASEAEASAAWRAQHWLAPWLAGGASVEEAVGASRALLGSAPVLPADALQPGPNGTFVNRRYGTPARPRIPPREAKGDFGLFEGISEARVEMSFEGDGLRTRVTWRGAAPP